MRKERETWTEKIDTVRKDEKNNQGVYRECGGSERKEKRKICQ